MSIIEFQKTYDTEDKCREELFKMRYPKGFKCSKCECTEYYYLKSRGKYQWKNCKHQSGTVMDKSHLKLTVWLWAIYLFSNDKRDLSACYISQVLKLPYKPAWFVLQRLRYAMEERENKYMLSGTVELDDTYVGAPTKGKKRGWGTEKMKVITALSKDENGKPQYLKGVTINMPTTTSKKILQLKVMLAEHTWSPLLRNICMFTAFLMLPALICYGFILWSQTQRAFFKVPIVGWKESTSTFILLNFVSDLIADIFTKCSISVLWLLLWLLLFAGIASLLIRLLTQSDTQIYNLYFTLQTI